MNDFESNERNASSDNDEKMEPGENSSVVKSHYNSMRDAGLAERARNRIYHMRNFNNWMKSMLINEFIEKVRPQKLGEPLKVMDMCCGKGGDLLKFEKAGVTHLICTDIAGNSVDQCKARYDELKRKHSGKLFEAEFITCDNTIERLRGKYKDPTMKLNMVSCQFAFHYSFESLRQVEFMTRNAAECLRDGGYFIATIPDANEIMRRQRLAESNSFGNSVYEIDFVCDTEKPPLFGAKYRFSLDKVVNDCPEFLVYFPLLVEVCKKYGLELVKKTSFPDYFAEKKEYGKDLLQRMKTLEYYSKNSQSSLYGKPEDYAHVTSDGQRTLSMPEWEAICKLNTT